jgi:hypothetical protein
METFNNDKRIKILRFLFIATIVLLMLCVIATPLLLGSQILPPEALLLDEDLLESVLIAALFVIAAAEFRRTGPDRSAERRTRNDIHPLQPTRVFEKADPCYSEGGPPSVYVTYPVSPGSIPGRFTRMGLADPSSGFGFRPPR